MSRGIQFSPVVGIENSEAERDYFAASFYAMAAGGVPFVDSERHRLTASLHAGIGQDLDHFSAFRLSSRPTAGEWEAVARPDLPGAVFDEFFSRSYGITELRYRYEALFFFYPYVRANWAWIDRPRFQENGRIGNQMDPLPSLSAGFISGAPWRSQIELSYVYNFGILRDTDGKPGFGGHSILFQWAKEF